MAHITVGVEYAIHALLLMVGNDHRAPSSRDLADLLGVSPSFVAKLFPKLEKAGIVAASEGVRGGYRLARPAATISFLEIVDAIEGEKPLFDCQEVRRRCPLYAGKPPSWVTRGRCAVHATMVRAEEAMRASLAQQTLGAVAEGFARTAPRPFLAEVDVWLDDRIQGRLGSRVKAVGSRSARDSPD